MVTMWKVYIFSTYFTPKLVDVGTKGFNRLLFLLTWETTKIRIHTQWNQTLTTSNPSHLMFITIGTPSLLRNRHRSRPGRMWTSLVSSSKDVEDSSLCRHRRDTSYDSSEVPETLKMFRCQLYIPTDKEKHRILSSPWDTRSSNDEGKSKTSYLFTGDQWIPTSGVLDYSRTKDRFRPSKDLTPVPDPEPQG